MQTDYTKGIAFIFEGDTEQIFYTQLLKHVCSKKPNTIFAVQAPSDEIPEVHYKIQTPKQCILVTMNVVGTASQIGNSGKWYQSQCLQRHRSLLWDVFLCYDTDNYESSITQFAQNDWPELHKLLQSRRTHTITDLAASADIEDIMLCDLQSIFLFLGISNVPIPSASKGKWKMKKLFRSCGPGKAYHEGKRAKSLIESLDMDHIINTAPIPLREIERICFE